MEIIYNTNKTLRDDLSKEIHAGSKMEIAAACFSIYAFQELKAELESIDELRFFTSPAFTNDKVAKVKHEFYIPYLFCECSYYHTVWMSNDSIYLTTDRLSLDEITPICFMLYPVYQKMAPNR